MQAPRVSWPFNHMKLLVAVAVGVIIAFALPRHWAGLTRRWWPGMQRYCCSYR